MLNLLQANGNGEQKLWEDWSFQVYCKYEVACKKHSAIRKRKRGSMPLLGKTENIALFF
jgi:hypothetical protein